MKFTKITVTLFSAFALVATGCADKNKNDRTVSNSSTSAPEEVSCRDLAGKNFEGVDGNVSVPSQPPEACEGCGNPGFINFESATEAELVLPDDDQGQSCTYTVSDQNKVHLSCLLSEVNLKITDSCSRLEGEGMVFVER